MVYSLLECHEERGTVTPYTFVDIGRQTGARQTAPLGASCELLNAVMALCLGKFI